MQATPESIERRIRRIENDPTLQAASCVHPFARSRLQFGRPERLILIIDPTTQDERVVMLTVSVWYRGRALPLAWAIWPAQQPLTDTGFWERVAALLHIVAALLPLGVPVVWAADRAFGSPAFTDLPAPYGWLGLRGARPKPDPLSGSAGPRTPNCGFSQPAQLPHQRPRPSVQKARLAQGQCGCFLGQTSFLAFMFGHQFTAPMGCHCPVSATLSH